MTLPSNLIFVVFFKSSLHNKESQLKLKLHHFQGHINCWKFQPHCIYKIEEIHRLSLVYVQFARHVPTTHHEHVLCV